MEVRGRCSVGGASSIGRGRGGCTGENISGSYCQRLRAGRDLQHVQATSHSRNEGSFGLKSHRCDLSSMGDISLLGHNVTFNHEKAIRTRPIFWFLA